MSDEKWVTLTPEQVEALEQGVIVRAHRGDVTVQGPLEGLVGEHGPDVWVSDIRVKLPDWIDVRERDVPKPEDTGEPDLLECEDCRDPGISFVSICPECGCCNHRWRDGCQCQSTQTCGCPAAREDDEESLAALVNFEDQS